MDQSSAPLDVPAGTSPVTVYSYRGFDVGDDGLDTAASQQSVARSKSHPGSDQLREPSFSSPAHPFSSNLAWFPWESLPPPNWLRDEREVHILKHYIDVLSTWV